MLPALTLPPPTQLPINHVAFAVADIRAAVDTWVRTLGAGPFFLIENMAFDFVRFRGEPCIFDHSAAFGQCGPIAIELQQIHRAWPAELESGLLNGGCMNHVGFMSTDHEAESARLSAMGFDLTLHAGAGEMEVRFHDARKVLGYSLEVHRRCDFIEQAFKHFADASVGWRGEDPLRLMTPDILGPK